MKIRSEYPPTVALSVLSLELSEPVNGWAAALAEQGVEITLDDLGRLSISRAAARRLFEEKRAAEQKARDLAAANERAAVERDREWRAQLHPGVPWHRLPDPGLLPVQQLTAAAKAAEPRRTPTQNEWLFGETDTMIYHEFPTDDES
jgi:hypothetical protein